MTPQLNNSESDFDFNKPTPTSFLDELRNHDQIAWKRFIMLYGRLVSYWCFNRKISNRTVRQEILKDVMIRVMESINTFHKEQPTDKFRNWLHVVVDNHINTIQRAYQECGGQLGSFSPDSFDIADPHSSVLGEIIKKENIERSQINPFDIENLNEDLIYAQDLMRVLGTRFSKRDIDIYYQITCEHTKAVHVAEKMGLSATNVRQIRKRINDYLRDYFGILNDMDCDESEER